MFFIKEEVDYCLWPEMCSVVLGSGSVVYEECEITSQSLPHGDINIIASRIAAADDDSFSIGVVVTNSSASQAPWYISEDTHNAQHNRIK